MCLKVDTGQLVPAPSAVSTVPQTNSTGDRADYQSPLDNQKVVYHLSQAIPGGLLEIKKDSPDFGDSIWEPPLSVKDVQ